MGLNVSGVGVITLVCSKCNFKLYWYVIGDKSNRNKFSGPPVPSKALAGYDKAQCPRCEAPLSVARPRKIEIMTRDEFEEEYVVTKFEVLRRTTLVEEHIRRQIEPTAAVDAGEATSSLNF
ncbi:hypothetical protein APE_1789.1 [Aeropyrum pernix K1]|uniref:Uncharacterized protein n=2 Tax=Aeropyrum pernix TaxID=56636 RepID=Q9YB06_AERPE|nr:hypothetical protein [Aeropyrum pernix]BAA80792.2 hypothetical protein APE_1789.1 [Aeropyrum pernix K1]GBF08639.1 hypothetical protein apy_03640 [Aeropyrum pernix]